MENETFLLVFGIALTLLPIIWDFFRPNKLLFRIIYLITLLSIGCALLFSGKSKLDNDRNIEIERTAMILKLQTSVENLQSSASNDSLRDLDFSNNLKNQFGITRDSLTNMPIQIKSFKLENNLNKGINYGTIGGANNQVYNFGKPARLIDNLTRQKLIYELSQAKGCTLDISFYQGEETNQLAAQLSLLFEEAGWKVSSGALVPNSNGKIEKGLILNGNAKSNNANVILNVMNGLGFSYRAFDIPHREKDNFGIIVGFQ